MRPGPVRDRRHGDDARGRGERQRGQQPAGEREVAEHVGAELQLEAVRGLATPWRSKDACIVDQAVERDPAGEQFVGDAMDRLERRKVEQDELSRLGRGTRSGSLRTQLLERFLAARAIAAGQQDDRAMLGEGDRGRVADAAVGAGDEEALADLRRHVSNGPALAHGSMIAGVILGEAKDYHGSRGSKLVAVWRQRAKADPGGMTKKAR